ncbi:hypothetical protein [Streptomyces sp. NPDC093990]|uniref:hypothetical protein n=1 Tax=Streptomyces sp. NPDC093990 TaxID=3155306 RepID=UPI0034397527
MLLLRGRPTREPVPHYGPFVMQAMTPPPAGQTPRPRSGGPDPSSRTAHATNHRGHLHPR